MEFFFSSPTTETLEHFFPTSVLIMSRTYDNVLPTFFFNLFKMVVVKFHTLYAKKLLIISNA